MQTRSNRNWILHWVLIDGSDGTVSLDTPREHNLRSSFATKLWDEPLYWPFLGVHGIALVSEPSPPPYSSLNRFWAPHMPLRSDQAERSDRSTRLFSLGGNQVSTGWAWESNITYGSRQSRAEQPYGQPCRGRGWELHRQILMKRSSKAGLSYLPEDLGLSLPPPHSQRPAPHGDAKACYNAGKTPQQNAARPLDGPAPPAIRPHNHSTQSSTAEVSMFSLPAEELSNRADSHRQPQHDRGPSLSLPATDLLRQQDLKRRRLDLLALHQSNARGEGQDQDSLAQLLSPAKYKNVAKASAVPIEHYSAAHMSTGMQQAKRFGPRRQPKPQSHQQVRLDIAYIHQSVLNSRCFALKYLNYCWLRALLMYGHCLQPILFTPVVMSVKGTIS